MLSEVGPLAGAAARRTFLRGPRAWIFAWCGLLVTANAIGVTLAVQHINNHWVVYVFVPLQGAVILWALSLWQTRQMARLTIRTAIPPFIVAWAVLLLWEDMSNFSAVAEPVYSLLALGAALYTLLTRSSEATEPLVQQDWFWICAGLALHFGALATLTPLSAALVKTHPEVVTRAYDLRAVVNVLAFVAITIGILCPLPPPHSGASSSPASSV